MSTALPMTVSGSATTSRNRSRSVGWRPDGEEPITNLAGVGRDDVREAAAAAVDGDVAAGPDVDQAPGPQVAGPARRELGDAAARSEETVERPGDADHELVVRPLAVDGADLGGVEVLDQDPPARCQRGNEPVEHVEALGHVLQHEPLVDDVPRPVGDGVGDQVELTDLQLWAAVVAEPPRVEIRRHDLTSGPDLAGQPTGDRPAAGADLQASGAGADAEPLQVADRDGVEGLVQAVEAIGGLRLAVGQQVVGLPHDDTSRRGVLARFRIWAGTVIGRDDHAPDAVAFPELDDEQLAVVLELGQRRQVREGDVLFSPADDHYDWIVILSGSVEILGPNEQLITRHGARRFLGEISLVTRQRPYLSTRVAEAGEVVVVPADVFRSKVLTDVRLSDTVLEAFLARRTALLSSAADTLQIVGSEYTPASMALREYAVRNRLPHHWIDADAHDDVASVLDGLGVTAADLPLVITERAILKRATPGDLAFHLGMTADALPERCYDLVVVGPDRPGWPRRSTARPRGCGPSRSTPSRSAGRRPPAPASRTTWASRPASPARTSPPGRPSRPRSSAP